MTGLDLRQFHDFVVRPALRHAGLDEPARVRLVTGTALVESGLRYIDQIAPGPGPAYGPFQMERATHNDLWQRFLAAPRHLDLASKIKDLSVGAIDPVAQMHGNHYYAAAMCAVHYLRAPGALPAADDLPAMARMWKVYYNTRLGAGRIEDFLRIAAPVLSL
jgi:hypothetical protein